MTTSPFSPVNKSILDNPAVTPYQPEQYLGDQPLEWSEWDVLWNYITGDKLTKTADYIADRANWNKGIKCYPMTVSKDCIGTNVAAHIITVYRNMVNEGKIPEYDRKNNPSKISFIEKEVAKNSNQPLMNVKIVLWELYWAWRDGSLAAKYGVNPQKLIQPLSYDEDEDKNNNDPEETECGFGCQFNRFVTWGLIIASGYLAVKFYERAPKRTRANAA